jgi:hypothetical protein
VRTRVHSERECLFPNLRASAVNPVPS